MWNLTNWWELMSRVHFTSRREIIQSKRMESVGHEDRSSFGSSGQLPSRPLRNRDHDQLFVRWWNLFLGHDLEWNKRIRDGDDWGESQDDHIDYIGECTGKLLAKARPKQTSMPTTSSLTVTLPHHLREQIDVEPGKYDESCTEVSQKMIRLLRHDPTVLQEEDGAVQFRVSARMFQLKFTSSQYWSIGTWLN